MSPSLMLLCLTILVWSPMAFAQFRRFDLCINKHVCECDDSARVINCTCAKDVWIEESNVTLDVTTMSINSFNILNRMSYLGFRRCNVLWFAPLTVSSYPPEVMEVSGVADLQMQSNVFHDVHRGPNAIKRLTIESTRMVNLTEYVFSDISGIENIEFRNVTIGTIRPHAFHMVTNLKSLTIVDCRIDVIAHMAFSNVSRLGTIAIINSTIQTLEAEAIVVHTIQEFTLRNTFIRDWKNRSVTLANVSRVSVRECQVSAMEGSALTIMLGSQLNFQRNVIGHLKNNALIGFGDSIEVNFNDNVIRMTDPNSMDILLKKENKNHIFRVVNNTFPCDDNLCWLLHEDKQDWSVSTLRDNNCQEQNFSLTHFSTKLAELCLKTGTDSGRSADNHEDHDAGDNGSDSIININCMYCTVLLIFFTYFV